MFTRFLYKQRHAVWQKLTVVLFLPFFVFVTLGLVVLDQSNQAAAAASENLNFQGRLLTNTGGLVPDGSYNVQFNLYAAASGGSSEWTETRLNSGGQGVVVRNGYFSVYLGDVTAFPNTIDWEQEHWLGMTIRGSGTCSFAACTPTDSEMTPRFKLTAVPYAFRAGAITDSLGNSYTGDDLIQKAPSAIQSLNSALAAIRLNQAGSGGLLQLQGDGTTVFSVDKTGGTTLGAGIKVGNSSSAVDGTIRWSGTDLEVFDGSSWVSLTSGSGGGGGGTLTYDSFYGYDAGGNVNIAGGWTDLTLDTEVKEDGPFTHAAGAAAVTISEDGWYEISYNVSAYTTSGGNNQVSLAGKLQENTGGGFTDIPGSFGYSAVTTGPADGSVSVTVSRQFSAGDIVKAQAQRATGSITMLTRPDSVGLTIRKIVESGGGGGGSGTSFEQNGNSFGGTAVLGTTDANGLNIITNNATALSFTSGGSATFANGLAITSGGLTLGGNITGTGGLTIASGGGGDLTLDSASDVLRLQDATIRRTAAGTTTIDLLDASGGTTLSILNSNGTQTAGLLVEGSVSAQIFNGSGAGLTAIDGGSITTGTIADGRLSSNVALLDQNQTFTGIPTFNSGLTLGSSSSTTPGTIRWSGSDFEGYDGIQWVSLTSGGGGGGSPLLADLSSFHAYDAAGDINITAGWTNITFDTEVKEDAPYTHATDSEVITINEDGWYEITYDIGTYITTGGARTSSRAKLQENTGSGYTDIGGSQATMYNRNNVNGYDSASATIMRQFSDGDTIRMQAQSFNGTDTVLTEANTTRISIRKFTTSGGGGGSGTSFEQGGNDFGGTAILGTTGSDNLNFITNNSTALSLTTSNQAIFAGEIVANGGVILGDTAGDGLTINSSSVTLTNGLNFDSNTLVIDSSNNFVGINTSAPLNKFSLNTATTADVTAQAFIATGSTTAKGLVIQGASSQSADLFEIQNSAGTRLAAINSTGGLVLGLSTLSSTATSTRAISLPDASGTICLSGGSCGFLSLASGSFATDATTNNSIAINKTGASGNLLALQKNGGAVFTVSNTGALQIQNSSSTALDIRNTGGTSYFSVDTTSGSVRVGSSVADAIGVLFVLDTKNTTGDPTGVNGGQYYNSVTGKFRCYENGQWKDCISSTKIRSFIDTVADPLIDANTTNYWDTGAENNNATPNITLSAAGGSSVFGTVSFELTSATNQDVEATARVVRNVGTPPDCNATPGTAVGGYPGIFATNSGSIKSSTVTFVDTPPSPGTIVYYTLCSDAATAGNTSADITRIRFTLQEVTNNF